MDDAIVHYNTHKPVDLFVLVYTHGQEIHLAHEAQRAWQQIQERVKPTVRVQGGLINNGPGLLGRSNYDGGQNNPKQDDVDKQMAGQGTGVERLFQAAQLIAKGFCSKATLTIGKVGAELALST